MSVLSFRLLIVAWLLCTAGAGIVDFVFSDLVPVGAIQAIDAEARFSLFEHGWGQSVLALWAVASFCSAIGLLFLRRWARSMALWSTGVGFALLPFLGTSLASGWATALTEGSSTLWGAVVALAYFSPIGSSFSAQGDH